MPAWGKLADMSAAQYRAEFDAAAVFSNGGGLQVQGFRVDVPGPDVTSEQIATLLIASMNLLMVERVDLTNLRVFAEAHKGTHRGPSDFADRPVAGDTGRTWVELSHVISDGMITYPGLPSPELTAHLTREDSRSLYAPGTEFAIDRISMIGNTGTYLDSPYHRYEAGADLAALPLSSLADLPAVVIRAAGNRSRAVDVGMLAAHHVTGKGVLLQTGGDRHWGTPAYAEDAPYLTEAGARWLVEHGATLVGIDAVNIDDTTTAHRPAHSLLLAADIPIVEHLTGLDQLPVTGARFSAVPPRITGFGTFTVRAYASIPVTPH